jgi:hypothetical protein
MLLWEIIAVYSENHRKSVNTLCWLQKVNSVTGMGMVSVFIALPSNFISVYQSESLQRYDDVCSEPAAWLVHSAQTRSGPCSRGLKNTSVPWWLVLGWGEQVEGEQYGSRINTCFRFPRYFSTTMLPTPGGGGTRLLPRFKSPTNLRLLKNHHPLTDSLVRTTTTRCHDLSSPPVPRFSE